MDNDIKGAYNARDNKTEHKTFRHYYKKQH